MTSTRGYMACQTWATSQVGLLGFLAKPTAGKDGVGSKIRAGYSGYKQKNWQMKKWPQDLRSLGVFLLTHCQISLQRVLA